MGLVTEVLIDAQTTVLFRLKGSVRITVYDDMSMCLLLVWSKMFSVWV